MKKLLLSSSLLPLGLAASVTGVWTNVVENTTPAAPLVWTDAENWRDGTVPLEIGDSADFKTCPPSSSSVLRWIRLPDALALNAVSFDGSSGVCCLLGEELTLNGSFGTAGSASTNLQRIYANVTIPADAYPSFQRTEVCGGLSGSSIYPSEGSLRQRLDRAADAAGVVRENPCTIMTFKPSGNCSFGMVAPESSATALSSAWTLSIGSKIAARVATDEIRHALPVGTLVTAANGALPAGTFLRRVFDDNTIELSEAPTQTGATDLTFAAFTPNVTQYIARFNHFGNETSFGLVFSKYRAEDVFQVTIDYVNRPTPKTAQAAEAMRTTFDTESGLKPATVILRNLDNVKTQVVLGTCDLEFGQPATGNHPGFFCATSVRQNDASSVSRLTVGSGLTAYIPVFTNLVGSVEKAGAGTLVIGLTNAVANTGSLTVSSGTLSVTANGDGTLPLVGSLSLGAAGTLEIPSDGFRADTFVFSPGATLRGGPLYVSTPVDVTGLVLDGGASVLYSGDDGPVSSSIEPFVASNKPAFWVDVMNKGSFRSYSEDGVEYVTRWADTRETDVDNPTYLFATNVGSVAPQRCVCEGEDTTFVYVNFKNHQTTEASEMEHLVWSVPLKNIRAVFMVRDPGVGCGQALLGATARLADRYMDFRRNSEEGASIAAQLFHSGSSQYVRNGRHYLNGEETTWEGHYPYGMYSYSDLKWYRPCLQEVDTSGDCRADCFGALGPGLLPYKNFNGYDTVCECIVYTNELTEVERLGVEQYLMNKWVKKTVSRDRFAGAGKSLETLSLDGTATYAVSAGSRMNIGTVSGSGTFEKEGPGVAYVDCVQSAVSGISVKGGELIVRSAKPSRESLPAGAYLHLDASDETTLGKKLKGDQVSYGLETWSDCRGSGYLTATHLTTNLPTVATVKINGVNRQVVDFGPKISASAPLTDLGSATGMKFDNALQLRTLAIVIGSRQGGGFISGSTKASIVGGIWRENNGVSASDKLYAGGSSWPRYLQNGLYQNDYPGGTSWRVNGVEVNSRGTGLSGGFDLVVVRTPDPFACNALSSFNYALHCGGQEIAEVIYWERMLTDDETLRVETYLREKWFGAAPPADYAGAEAGAVEVASGATLTVDGESPLVVSSLAGAGSVAGEVAFATGATFDLAVAADGSTASLSATAIDVSTAVTVRLTGDRSAIRRLAAGRHVVVSSPSIHATDVCGWTLANAPATRSCRLRVIDGAVVLDVSKFGLILMIR